MVSDKARIAKLTKELDLLRDQSRPKVSKGQVFAFLKTEKGAIVFIVSVFALASLIILVWPNSDSKPKQEELEGRWENRCVLVKNPNWSEDGIFFEEFQNQCEDVFVKK